MTSTSPSSWDMKDAKNRLLLHIGKLLELNTNIELNLNDASFVADGGNITYVLDETVFETFVAPRHRRLAIASHFADGSKDGLARAANWESFETQSTIIAMEYLFSGAQAQDASAPVYITYWHEVERASRIDALLQAYALRARQHHKEIEAEKAHQNALIQAYEGSGTEKNWPVPEAVRHDMDRLTLEADAPIDLSRFAFTREAVELLADSTILEPTEQLNRLTSPRFEKRLKIFSQVVLREKFQFTDSDFEDLAAETYKWIFRIQDELKLNGRHRETGSIKSDAQSLALLCRLAAKLDANEGRKERLVFVTTDSIIFDVYRRWDCHLAPEQKGYYYPFLIRHAAQYLPLINLISGGSDLSRTGERGLQRVRKLFDMISEAVEICLLPFNISNLGGNEASTLSRTSRRAREDLSLRLSQNRSAGPDQVIAFFLRNSSSEWYTKSRASIEAIRDTWQEVERIAIGTFYDLVQKRLKEEDKVFPGLKEVPLDAASNEQMANYLFKALDNLLQRSVNVWIPLARTAIEELMSRSSDKRSRRRAPYTVWGEVTGGQNLHTICRNLQRHRGGGESVTHDLVESQDVLLVAAALAIATRDWSQAGRFAKLAERSLMSRKGAEDLATLDARFIVNLAQRFSMGQISGHFTSKGLHNASYVESALRHLMKSYEDVKESLSELIAIHERLSHDTEHYVRLIRAHSEVAALSLFTFASLSAARLNGHVFEGRINESQALADTKSHLMQCLALDRTFDPDPGSRTIRFKLRTVQSQYQANFACMEAERCVFVGREFFKPDPDILPLKADIKKHYELYKGRLSAIANLEIAAFLLLYGESSAEYKTSIVMYGDELKQSDIALDNFVAHAVAVNALDMM